VEGWRKPTQNSAFITRLCEEVLTRKLPNTQQKRYRESRFICPENELLESEEAAGRGLFFMALTRIFNKSSEVPTALLIETQFFQDIAREPGDENSTLFRNVSYYLRADTRNVPEDLNLKYFQRLFGVCA